MGLVCDTSINTRFVSAYVYIYIYNLYIHNACTYIVHGGTEKLIYEAQPKCDKIRESVLDYYHCLETVSPQSVRIFIVLLLLCHVGEMKKNCYYRRI